MCSLPFHVKRRCCSVLFGPSVLSRSGKLANLATRYGSQDGSQISNGDGGTGGAPSHAVVQYDGLNSSTSAGQLLKARTAICAAANTDHPRKARAPPATHAAQNGQRTGGLCCLTGTPRTTVALHLKPSSHPSGRIGAAQNSVCGRTHDSRPAGTAIWWGWGWGTERQDGSQHSWCA